MVSQLSRTAIVGAAALVFGVASAASGNILFAENFDPVGKEVLADGAAISGHGGIVDDGTGNGIASFNQDGSVGGNARFSVVDPPLFTAPVMTFSFDVVEPVEGETMELLFRAGRASSQDMIFSADFVLESILIRDGGVRDNFINDGNQSIFLVANNQSDSLNFASPVDGAEVTLGGFQYMTFLRRNDTGDFVAGKGITDFRDPPNSDPGDISISRFAIGAASSPRRGTFAIDNVGLVEGILFETVVPPSLLPGDANRDGRVDGEDFLIWQAAFGTQSGATWDDGDFNGDGRVDGEDFLIWQAHFGSVAAGSSALTPEPGPLAGLLLGAGLLMRRRPVRH